MSQPLTNRQVLAAPPSSLGSLDRQRRFLLQVYLTHAPCANPSCAYAPNQFEARGLDLDAWDFTHAIDPDDAGFTCPTCHYALRRIVPFVPIGAAMYYWMLNEPLPVKESV